jgi:DNA-binding protein H-NS
MAWRAVLLLGVLSLSACGVEVVTTTATVGELKAEEAKSAQQKMEQVQERLEEIQAVSAQHNAALEAALATQTPASPPEGE